MPSDLLKFDEEENPNASGEERIAAVKHHVEVMQQMIVDAKEKEIAEQELQVRLRPQMQVTVIVLIIGSPSLSLSLSLFSISFSRSHTHTQLSLQTLMSDLARKRPTSKSEVMDLSEITWKSRSSSRYVFCEWEIVGWEREREIEIEERERESTVACMLWHVFCLPSVQTGLSLNRDRGW